MHGGMLRKSSLAALLASAAISAAALTVDIAPAQDPAFAAPPDGRGSPLTLLVSGCMGAFFDSGYIVTDSSARFELRGSWGSSRYALEEAREGQVDFVIDMFVAWATSAYDKEVALPASADYRLVRVSDGKVLAEGSIEGIMDSLDSAAHEGAMAALMGTKIAEPSLKALSAIDKGGE